MLTSKLAAFTGFVGAAVIAIAVGPGASSALAASPDDQITVKVSVADLNMASETGARIALSRIRYAADQICDGGNNEKSLGQQMQVRACSNEAVRRAVAAMNLPALTAVSQGRHVGVAIASASH